MPRQRTEEILETAFSEDEPLDPIQDADSLPGWEGYDPQDEDDKRYFKEWLNKITGRTGD